MIRTYDVLYSLTPLKNALCTKDDGNDYCVSTLASTTEPSQTFLSTVAKYVMIPVSVVSASLSRRAVPDAQEIASIAPNATTFANNNLLFLMLQPDLPADKLCQTCTRQTILAYISFESSTPYAPGLGSSILLAGQSKLYQAVTNTCGADFLNGGVAAAAGLSGGLFGGDDDNGASQMMLANTGVTGAVVGVLALMLGIVL